MATRQELWERIPGWTVEDTVAAQQIVELDQPDHRARGPQGGPLSEEEQG